MRRSRVPEGVPSYQSPSQCFRKPRAQPKCFKRIFKMLQFVVTLVLRQGLCAHCTEDSECPSLHQCALSMPLDRNQSGIMQFRPDLFLSAGVAAKLAAPLVERPAASLASRLPVWSSFDHLTIEISKPGWTERDTPLCQLFGRPTCIGATCVGLL